MEKNNTRKREETKKTYIKPEVEKKGNLKKITLLSFTPPE